MKQQIVVVGAGAVYKEHYESVIQKLCKDGMVELLGIVDPKILPEDVGTDTWVVPSIADIPETDVEDVIAFVLTPDHYPRIQELATAGFRKIIVEKPLVSRDEEITKLQVIVEKKNLLLYAVDHYIPKTFPLAFMTGAIKSTDFRAQFISVEGLVSTAGNLLGDIEGISVQIVEAGDFCLPDLAGRPWLEHDPEIGGMLRDLGTHALAPLVTAGLINGKTEVEHVALSKIGPDRKSLVPLTDQKEVELYVSGLLMTNLVGRRVPVALSFGKVPFDGGTWSLEVRGSKGMFFMGLRTGQSGVFVPKEGPMIRFSLNRSTYRIVLEEALSYFKGDLGRFDGNVWPFTTSMGILQDMKKKYFSE